MTGERLLGDSIIDTLGLELNTLLIQMISSNPRTRLRMKFVKRELEEICQNEIKIARDRLVFGGKILLLGLIGLESYNVLREFD